jgi:hypothetical protein
MIKFVQKLSVVWAKNAIFRPIFLRKYFEHHIIGVLASLFPTGQQNDVFV